MVWRRLSAGAATLILVFGLNGCSGGSDSSESGPQPTGNDTAGTPPPVAPQPEPPDATTPDPTPPDDAADAAPRFDIVRVASGDAMVIGTALNNHGEVSGQSDFRAGVWSETDGVRSLSSVADMEDYGDWLNDAGWVAGHAEVRSAEAGEYTAAVWRADGSIATTGASVTNWINGSWSRGINAHGRSVGLYRDAGGSGFFQWDESGFVDLGTLGLAGQALNIRINDTGAVAASVLTAEGNTIVVREADGSQRVVGSGVLAAFNNQGAVAGCSDDQPVIWNADGTLTHPDPQRRRGCVQALNNRGDAVGSYYRGEELRWFLFQDGVFHDLQDLVAATAAQPIGPALAINDRGEILTATPAAWLDPAARVLRPRGGD